jgi:hypothetical protein
MTLAVFGLPQLGAYLEPGLTWRLFDDPCVQDVPRYYDCLSHLAWGARPMLLRAYESLGHGARPLLGLAYVLALAGVVALAARATRIPRRVGSRP